MHAKGCKLKWEPPEDDGGKPVNYYQVEKMDTATGSWVPVGRAENDKPEIDVPGLIPGKEYQFRVKAVNVEGESEPLVTDKAIVAKNPFGKSMTFSKFWMSFKCCCFSNSIHCY